MRYKKVHARSFYTLIKENAQCAKQRELKKSTQILDEKYIINNLKMYYIFLFK